MTCWIDIDPPEFISEYWRTARKEHTCCECGKKINPGDEYQIVAGKWEGYFDAFKTCEKCADLRDSLIEAGGCPLYCGLYEEYEAFITDGGLLA